MGEVFEAYAVLNKTLKLGLNTDQLMRAEVTFKSEYAKRAKFPKVISSREKLARDWEFVTMLVPREKSLNQKALSKLGGDVISKTVVKAGRRRAKAAPRTGYKKTRMI